MYSMDRKSSIIFAIAGTAALATLVEATRWGIANKHPIAGFVGGALFVAPAVGGIVGSIGRAIAGPSPLPSMPSEATGNGVTPIGPNGVNAAARAN